MKRSSLLLVASFGGAMAACGGGAIKLVVKEPLAQQCSAQGLKKCDELTQAVFDLAEGEKSAEQRLLRVAKANEPEKVQLFAKALEPIGVSIGGDAGALLRNVSRILTDSDAASPDGTTPKKTAPAVAVASGVEPKSSPPKASSSPTGVQTQVVRGSMPNLELDGLRSGMARPSSDAHSQPCDVGPLGDGSKCKRVRAFVGPIVVTTLYASGGCPDELFVMAGRLEKPHWFVGVLPNSPLTLTSQLIVEDGEDLNIGTRWTGPTPRTDIKCSIVWSGFRPITSTSVDSTERYGTLQP